MITLCKLNYVHIVTNAKVTCSMDPNFVIPIHPENMDAYMLKVKVQDMIPMENHPLRHNFYRKIP